ncbi:MAG: hypothetical protein AB7O62_15270 [Pirellulales bacterium]
MIAKLSNEQAAALRANGERELGVVDPDTQRTYFLVDAETHRQAMDALRRQNDYDAIAQGIAEMEAGLAISVKEAREFSRQRLQADGQ